MLHCMGEGLPTGKYTEITRDYWRLLEITRDYRRLLEITRDY